MKYAETFHPTPNVSSGVNLLKGVVLHHTGGAYAGAVAWLCNPASQASAHVVIARTGERTVLAKDTTVCWHAGRSAWKGVKWCNGFMLGIEFEGNTQVAPLTDEQIESMLEYLVPRIRQYGWQVGDGKATSTPQAAGDITDHRTVAPLEGKIDLKESELERCLAALRNELANPRNNG